MRQAGVLGMAAAVAVVGVASVQAQDAQHRQLAEFDAISVGGAVDLTIVIGGEFSAEVVAHEGEPEQLITEVRGGRLDISLEPVRRGWFGRTSYGDYDVTVTLPELTQILASGASQVHSDDLIQTAELSVSASGASDVSLRVDAQSVRVSTSGAADVHFRGTVQEVDAEASGGSDIDAAELTAARVSARSSGGADILLNAYESLSVTASGGSDIAYRGEPADVDVRTSGGAGVRRL